MKKSWSQRFRNDFSFSSVPVGYFWKSEWENFDPHDQQMPVSMLFYCYRFLYMCFFIGATSENFICNTSDTNSFFPIYLTNQTFFLQTIYSTLYFLFLTWILLKNRVQSTSSTVYLNNNVSDKGDQGTFHTESNRLPIVCGFLWVMINILNVVPYVVTIIYWIFLYDPNKESRACEELVNIFVHGLNSPLVLLDALIISVPIRRSHFVFPLIFSLYYCTFSGLYEVGNGVYNAAGDKEYIYPMLNWRSNLGLAIGTCIGALIGSVILHLITGWGLYRTRLYIKSKCSKISRQAPNELAIIS